MLRIIKSAYHYFLAWFGNVIYRFPSRKIFVLGVTGTKGKSTTLELINTILESAGKKTALVSSIRLKIGDYSEQNTTGMTMPGRLFIQRFLRKAANAGCRYFLMEVTSQGILQHRHRFIDFDAAIFTNLHPEHIEAHGSFEKYRGAKMFFFQYVAKKSKKSDKLFFINKEDAAGAYFADGVKGSGRIIYFSIEDFLKELEGGKTRLSEWLKDDFNTANAAAAAAFAKSQNIDWQVIEKAFSGFNGVPGRMEYVAREPFAVVIDYAHTPDSLEKVYETLRGVSLREISRRETNGKAPCLSCPPDEQAAGRQSANRFAIRDSRLANRLICVLGAAGGGRDKWKRPAMGKIASKYCDFIILTNEDPYDENPDSILDQIASGFSETRNEKLEIRKILDRKEAIKTAIFLAGKGDAVIITGKGSESWMHLKKGKKILWNERKIVEEAMGIR